MNKNSIIYLMIIGLIGIFSSCKKDETKVVMMSSPNAPTLTTVPDLTLKRANALDTVVFVGTAVNPGFNASATYFLEVDTSGNQFSTPTVLASGSQDKIIKFSVGDINGALIKRFPSDVVSSLELRIRSVLVQDAGTGVAPFVSISPTKSVEVTTYGLPRLDILSGTTVIGKIESALGDGHYTGFVKLDKTKPYTLKDPDADIVYGATGNTLAVNGAAITSADNGWYIFDVNTTTLNFTTPSPYFIGLIGDATANGWNSPDTKMDYNAKNGTWFITTTLTNATVKFRLNDGWAVNWGGKGSGDGNADNYASDGKTVALAAGGKNIGLLNGAGTYTITLDIAGLKATIVKNN